MTHPKISVCIPAYNRAELLPELLESILSQDFRDFEVVIAEDGSPERATIRNTVKGYEARYPGVLIYSENKANLGYDGNIRHLVELASGEYVFFMGNDDLMCPGALSTVASAVDRHPNIGVVLRSYAAFTGKSENVVQTFRYFDRELFFPAGTATIATIYRRSVVIPGMVVHRESAVRLTTDRFDGTLLYQLYLVAEILVDRNAVFLPDVIVLYRNGGVPDFGSSPVERGRFTPKVQTPASSLHFMRGMLDIARHVEHERGLPIYRPILRDIANYSYPILSIQGKQRRTVFLRYGWGLARMGLGRHLLFWIYWLSILLFGVNRVDRIIGWIKRRMGHTPVIGGIYRGISR